MTIDQLDKIYEALAKVAPYAAEVHMHATLYDEVVEFIRQDTGEEPEECPGLIFIEDIAVRRDTWEETKND
jgi:hypothetical protein